MLKNFFHSVTLNGTIIVFSQQTDRALDFSLTNSESSTFMRIEDQDLCRVEITYNQLHGR